MSKRTLSLVTAALVAALAPTALRAQNSATSPAPGPARSNRVTLGGAFGGLSGAANLNPAGTFGAGLEYSFGRVGVRAEGRDFVYKFDRFGFDKTQHDIAWQGGLTLSF